MSNNYRIICEYSKKANKKGQEKFYEQLKANQNLIGKLRLFLFHNPEFALLAAIIILLFFLFYAHVIDLWSRNIIARAIFLMIFLIVYLSSTTSLLLIKPKYKAEWHEHYYRIYKCFLQEAELNKLQARKSLKRDLHSYIYKSQYSKFIINLLWGGIVVGAAASDLDFQKAILNMSISEMYKYNIFATCCMVILPFVYLYYSSRYEVPIARIKNILLQIDIEIEAEDENPNTPTK